jgi:hypothetical protein
MFPMQDIVSEESMPDWQFGARAGSCRDQWDQSDNLAAVQ